MKYKSYKIEGEAEVPVGAGKAIESCVLSVMGPMIYGDPRWSEAAFKVERMSMYKYRCTWTCFAKIEDTPSELQSIADLRKQGLKVTELPNASNSL